ncbi:beta-lactamase/transpeptidase-like protein [Aspergillus heteromorphus CBS 117.55]|uniref:Beta-lactamase/transpeptidase-like protein n=1 Tax=Aspergillus heteromorphus CBS 117.55 TaxID=1448321 RepID=A0A317WQ99_9EURO|nr:beta-lactamase/transpeptidase-like protein [Aspergillus heteromorphus CBS 117.55]PWY88225.1 beta-lactamase/transpeptidase-like protein [Aspergillus heteromorphus CBS 117.55]
MVLRTTTSPLTPEFDDLVASLLEKWKIPGLTIAIIHGSTTHSKAYGFASLPTQTPMTPTTLFSTCSTTKAFTAAALSLTLEDSQTTPTPITWTTPVSTLMRDDFVLSSPALTSSTTIEDILSHRTGLPGHFGAMSLAQPSESLRTAVRKLRHLDIAYPPRTRFVYCNHMFIAASHLLESLTHKPMSQTLKERIWTPLGMNDTYFDVHAVRTDPALSPRLATGYVFDPVLNTQVSVPYLNYAPTTGTGAIVSTVLDYAHWIRALIYQSPPLSPQTHRSLRLPRSVISADDWDGMLGPPAGPGGFHLYSLGWFVDVYAGQQIYYHSGSWEGFGIMVGFLPGRGWGFAMMGNSQDARIVQLELYLTLIDNLLGRTGAGVEDERTAHIRKLTERWTPRVETLPAVIDRLFPTLNLHTKLPHSLTLDSYTGTYTHPAYGTLVLEIRHGGLFSDLTDRVIPRFMRFEHVSGEFFVVKYFNPEAEDAGPEFIKVEFYVDGGGVVGRVGLDMEPALGGEKTWFARAGGGGM